MNFRVLVLSGSMVWGGCSGDDASAESGGSSSTSAADTGTPMATMGQDGTTTGAPGDSESTAAADSSGTTMPIDGTSTGPDSTDSSGSDSEGDSSTGDAESSGTTDACVPLSDDPSAIGTVCTTNDDCPGGYTCQPFNGVVQQLSCQLLCEQTCECPDNHSCNQIMDKGATWNQCTGP